MINYQDLYEQYAIDKYFKEISITICYKANNDGYIINDIRIDTPNSPEQIQEIVTRCQNRFVGYRDNKQLFYLYKEMLQNLASLREKIDVVSLKPVESQLYYNYFRGQSHNYELRPGILRTRLADRYRREFERPYKQISNEFPNHVIYSSLQETDLHIREEALSILQHFTMKTSLLDITKNPFIAMLFMFSGVPRINSPMTNNIDRKYVEDNERKPTLYLFDIKEDLDYTKTLFSEVKRNPFNSRIIAQKGAFLNFDKACLWDEEQLPPPIPVIKIVLSYDWKFQQDDFSNVNGEEAWLDKDILEAIKEDSKKNLISQFEEYEQTLKYIFEEIKLKLAEYYYIEGDLCPDFEKRIEYISNLYEHSNRKDIKLLI